MPQFRGMAVPVVEGAAAKALRSVLLRVRRSAETAGTKPEGIRVVAVSKTKPVSLIQEVYDAGHRCFGENYVQEFVQKAPQLPEDIEWHFIGHLQTNKVKTLLAAVPNLAFIQGVDNEKVANQLDKVVSSLGRNPLKVFVQVNTSGEACLTGISQNLVALTCLMSAAKSGVDPSCCVQLVEHLKTHCPNLGFSGLMTIGMPNYTSTPENFQMLMNCRLEVCKTLGIAEEKCELSMGMSGDFEQAIKMGSTSVRIGTTIFGPRDYTKK